MVRRYRYITFADRREIAALYQANERPADIADRLGVTTRRAYNPVIAQQTVQANFRRRGRTPAEEQGGFNGDSV